MYGSRRIIRISTISATECLPLRTPGGSVPCSWSKRPHRGGSPGPLDMTGAGDDRMLHAAWRGRLRHIAAFGPGNQPPDTFLDPNLCLPPQQLLGLGGTIAQPGLRGGGSRARLVWVDGLEGRACQPQQDLSDVIERGVDP